MKREIKFRGKRRSFNQWVYFNLLNEINSEKEPSEFMQYNLDKDSVGQFTGIKDKNGLEIYEGDILYHEAHKTKTVMKWVNDFACFCGETVDEIVKEEFNFYQKIDQKNLKIIGNIYENRETII